MLVVGLEPVAAYASCHAGATVDAVLEVAFAMFLPFVLTRTNLSIHQTVVAVVTADPDALAARVPALAAVTVVPRADELAVVAAVSSPDHLQARQSKWCVSQVHRPSVLALSCQVPSFPRFHTTISLSRPASENDPEDRGS